MLYTRKGDTGTSGLFGTKDRYPKHSAIYESLGTVDELNSLLGVCRAKANKECIEKRTDEPDIASELLNIQEHLFIIQAELAGTDKTITQKQVAELEQATERFEQRITNPHAFVIPGTTEYSALCDYARAVARRAERAVMGAQSIRPVSPSTLAYLNRLSSFLYALARSVATKDATLELSPTYQ